MKPCTKTSLGLYGLVGPSSGTNVPCTQVGGIYWLVLNEVSAGSNYTNRNIYIMFGQMVDVIQYGFIQNEMDQPGFPTTVCGCISYLVAGRSLRSVQVNASKSHSFPCFIPKLLLFFFYFIPSITASPTHLLSLSYSLSSSLSLSLRLVFYLCLLLPSLSLSSLPPSPSPSLFRKI